MKFYLPGDLPSLQSSLHEFVQLAGPDRWARRIAHLRKEVASSFSRAKIVGDTHWLELELGDFYDSRDSSASVPRRIGGDALAGLLFTQTLVEVHRRLTPQGKKVVEGRIRDCIKNESGFAPLYIEMDIVRLLTESGYDVNFPDIEGSGSYDVLFRKGEMEGEVECKSISVDAGRKIHRRDFYRFVDAVSPNVIKRAATAGVHEVLVVTVDDRLPKDDAHQEGLRSTTRRMLLDDGIRSVSGEFFSVVREPFILDPDISETALKGFYESCRRAYGYNCHVSGVATTDATCLIVLRSRQEDDTSRPQLESLKKAATQFSTKRPAFIVVQYEDVKPEELTLLPLRKRAAILSYHLFLETQAAHVSATYFCPYGGLTESDGRLGTPAFAIPNPRPKLEVRKDDYPTFFAHISDAEFARKGGTLNADGKYLQHPISFSQRTRPLTVHALSTSWRRDTVSKLPLF